MDVERMLEMCRRDQWSVDDLDWGTSPRALSRDDEVAVVQLFTDMAGIELLAAALFREQRARVHDPHLQEIFATFVVDEERHAKAAARLAAYYDVHRYKAYRISPNLEKFTPHFVNAIRHLSDDVANVYITGGELILDIALLRSLNDYVADDMSARAMRLINRDESRHIAVDYHMVEHYASDAYTAELAQRAKAPLADRLRAYWTFANVLYRAQPFFRDVFFSPMQRVDPSGDRLREAFKRLQLLGLKPGVKRPFAKFMLALQGLFNHPVTGALFGQAIARVAGVDPAFMKRFYDDAEEVRVRGMSYDDLATEALGVKG